MTNDESMMKAFAALNRCLLEALTHNSDATSSKITATIRASSFLQLLPHEVFLVGAGVGFFCGDQTALVEINQCVIHQTHALFLSGLNNSRQHIGFVLANHVGHSWCIGENLQREDATGPIFPGDELM